MRLALGFAAFLRVGLCALLLAAVPCVLGDDVPASQPQTQPQTQPVAAKPLVAGPYSIGVSDRQVRQGESLIVWAISEKGELTPDSLKLTSVAEPAKPAAYTVIGYFATVNPWTRDPRFRKWTFSATAAPGVYRLSHNAADLGTITVLPAWPAGIERAAGRTDDLNTLVAAAADGDTIVLPDAAYTLTNSLIVSKKLTFQSRQHAEIILGSGQLDIRSDCAFSGITFRSNGTPHPAIYRYGEWRVAFRDCTFVSFQMNQNGASLQYVTLDSCKFEKGAGISTNSATIVNCKWSGWPAYTHPLVMGGPENLVAGNSFEGTERAIVGQNITFSAFTANRFNALNINRANEGEVILIEDGDLRNCYFGQHRYTHCRGPAIEVYGGTRPIVVTDNLFEDFDVIGSACAIALVQGIAGTPDKPGGRIVGNLFRNFRVDSCAQVAALSSPDRSTVGNRFANFLVTDQKPVLDHNGNMTNTCPVSRVMAVGFNPSGNRLVTAAPMFMPEMDGAQVNLSGPDGGGWPKTSFSIAYQTPMSAAIVGGSLGDKPLTNGTLTIVGAKLFESSDAGNTGSQIRVIRPFSSDPLGVLTGMRFTHSLVVTK